MSKTIIPFVVSDTNPSECASTTEKIPGSSAESSAEAEVKPNPIAELFALEPDKATDEQIQDIVGQAVSEEVAKTEFGTNFNILILFDENLSRSTANRIYNALSAVHRSKPILLVLNTPGGDIAAAYLIAKLCREHTSTAFEVAVPRRAKSAGTLICCGADKVHMGSLSELGPIDPQFGAIPALALKHSVEHIAELVGTYPAASQMFSDYLERSLRIEALGYFERVAESAAQYASRLLNSRRQPPTDKESDVTAKHLVYAYKDHGFVIDAREALTIFGDNIVVQNTGAYNLANGLHDLFELIKWICDRRFDRDFSYVGGPKQGCRVSKKTSS